MKLIDTTLLAAVLAFSAPMALPVGSANAASIQTQMDVNANAEVDVVKAQISGDIMTIILMFRNTAGKEIQYKLNSPEIFYIDKAANKKFFMLKDTEKKWVASNVYYHSSGSYLNFKIKKDEKKLIWMKFPSPAAGVETIDFSMPSVLPFDGLKVSR